MAKPLSSGCWSMYGRTVRSTFSRPWAAGRFNAPLVCFLLPYSLPAWRRPYWWLAVCCELLTCLGELRFYRTERGRNRCSISFSHETQTSEASEIEHPLCVYSASWRCWRRGWLRYGPGLSRGE